MTRWCAARKRYGLRPCPKTNSTAFSNGPDPRSIAERSEEHTSELQSRFDLVCRLLLEKKKRALIPGVGIAHWSWRLGRSGFLLRSPAARLPVLCRGIGFQDNLVQCQAGAGLRDRLGA